MDRVLTRLPGETATDVHACMHACMHAPLVTIVIVNYNYGEFVGRCIRSAIFRITPIFNASFWNARRTMIRCRSLRLA
jgi:hypothetical protein